jgi:hypothetical protein
MLNISEVNEQKNTLNELFFGLYTPKIPVDFLHTFITCSSLPIYKMTCFEKMKLIETVIKKRRFMTI